MSLSVATASLIGGGLSFSGGLFSNRTNRKIAEENLAYQKEANEKNMALTEQANLRNIAFQQQENEITRQREDNAVQRAAADMTAAGLSKTLAAGNPASAQGLSSPQVDKAQVQALNNQYKYESALQRMNIAQLMQDMSVKDEQLKQSKALNDANIELIKAQAENYNNQNSVFMQNFENEKLLKFSQITLNEARKEQVRAETELSKIVGDYKSKEIQADIDLKVSQRLYYASNVQLNAKNIEKMSTEIAHYICQDNKLNKEAELVIKDMVYKELQIRGLTHDVEYAEKTGLPVGSMPNGLLGSGLSTGMTIRNLINSKFGIGQEFKFYSPTNSYVPVYELGGGYAW